MQLKFRIHLCIIIDIKININGVVPKKFNGVKLFTVFYCVCVVCCWAHAGCALWHGVFQCRGEHVAAARLKHSAHKAARCTLPALHVV